MIQINKSKGSPRGKQPSLRRCVSCRQMIDKANLARVVRLDGAFSIDASGKSNGRGAYICKSSDCLQAAVKSRAFDRSFKCKVPAEIYSDLEALI